MDFLESRVLSLSFIQNIDFEKLACETDDDLVALRERWKPIFAENNDPGDLRATYRAYLVSFAISYARLVALSFGMKRHTGVTEDPFISRCWQAACDVCSFVVNEFSSPKLSKNAEFTLLGPR